jgi:hypothetical protein
MTLERSKIELKTQPKIVAHKKNKKWGWNAEDDKILVDGYNNGVKIKYIAKKLNRNLISVYDRIRTLKGKRKRKNSDDVYNKIKEKETKIEEVNNELKIKSMRKFPQVLVQWLDVCTIAFGKEEEISNVIKDELNHKYMVEDCGFLIYEDDEKIVVSSSIFLGNKIKSCSIIPKNYIKNLKFLN